MRGRMSARQRAGTRPPLRARSRTIRLRSRSRSLTRRFTCLRRLQPAARRFDVRRARVRQGEARATVGRRERLLVSRESGRHALFAAARKYEARWRGGNVLLSDCLQQGGRNGGPGAGGGGGHVYNEQGSMMPHMPYGADMMGAPFGAGAYQQQQQFPPNYMMPYPPQVGLL